MPKAHCPQCHSRAVRVTLIDGYKFYCSQCGWNRENVHRELSSSVKVSLVLAVLGAIFAVWVRFRNPSVGSMWIPPLLVFSVLPMYYALSGFLQERKMRNVPVQPALGKSRATATPEMASSDALSETTTFEEREFPELAALPRPRKLKLTWKGRFFLVFALAVVGLFTVYGLPAFWNEFRNPHNSYGKNLLVILPAVFIYWKAFTFFRNRFRERTLLANGELASGYVSAQQTGTYVPSIEYSFKLAGGKLVTGRYNDASHSLYEGMTVPVFYDPDEPTHSVPLDCSLTRIVKS
jgi:hypothetical protein